MARRLLAAINRLSAVAAWAAAAALALMAVLILAEVAMRNLAGSSLLVSWEYGAYAMAAVFFLAAGQTLKSGGHVRVGVAFELLGPAAARWLDLVATALALVFAGFIAFALIDLAVQSAIRGARTFLPSATPLAVPQAIVAVGAVILVLQLVARLLRLALGERVESGEGEGP